MTVLSKKSLLFMDSKASGQQRFLLKAGTEPQEAPDWIAQTRLFQLAVQDGTLYELVRPAVAAAPEGDSAPKTKKSAPAQFKQ